MDLALIGQVVTLIAQFGELVIKYGPQVIEDVEGVWNNLMLAIKSATSGTPLPDSERQQIRANLDLINTKLGEALQQAVKAVSEAQGVTTA